MRFEQGAEVLKCGVLLKKASHALFRRWREKLVIVTIGKIIWFPLPSYRRRPSDITITDAMRSQQRELGTLFISSLSNPPVLDEHTEFRGSLSLHPRSARGFDILTKRVVETPLALRSVDSLRSYIHSTSQSDSAVTPFRAAEEPAEDIDEKHFRCQSDEERESWLRVLRQARFPRFSFSR